jgi:RNA polymerase sigma-70 factor, ECF subfamily
VSGPRRPTSRSPRPDDELVRAVGEGDLGALGELYDRYARTVARVVSRVMRGSADVEDVVHTTFLKLPKIAPSYDGRTSCRAWLCGIGVRFALRHRRGAGRFRRMLSALGETAFGVARGDPEREAATGEDLDAFAASFAELSEKKRAAFVLVDMEGWSADEAAAALGIPAPTVRTRLFHARQELRVSMARRGVTPAAAADAGDHPSAASAQGVP